jgi:acetyl-CoA synthetase
MSGDPGAIPGNSDCYSLDIDAYRRLYKMSMERPEEFWAAQARSRLTWLKEWKTVLRENLDDAKVEWFPGATLNAAYNCLDRHLDSRRDKVAYYIETEDPNASTMVTYGQLARKVADLARVLRGLGVEPNDRVVIHLPNSIELVTAILACAGIGAIYCLVHSAYGREALAYRILTSRAKLVITADGCNQGGKIIPFRPLVDYALSQCPTIEKVLFFQKCGLGPDICCERGVLFDQDLVDKFPEVGVIERGSEDPLLILHAAPAIGKPRALVHTHGGYLLWAAMTAGYMFDLRDDDVFWVTSDLARMCGHTLGLYGTLLNGATGVIFDGCWDSVDQSRYWEIIEKRKVTKFCTRGSVIRTLELNGAAPTEERNLSSLKILGAGGEALSVENWQWLNSKVGKGKCPVIGVWGQAETGGPMIGGLPGLAPGKPGSLPFPFFGVEPVILDLNTGMETKFPNQEGAFFIGRSWPGMARTIFDDHAAFREAYLAPFQGLFITGEGARRDEDGAYWITGRIDDVINVAGHRMGAWELEAALSSHDSVVEATAVGYPHKTKGQGIYAFVKPAQGIEASDQLRRDLSDWISLKLGPIAVPDRIQWTDGLPKTRSGKVLRRVLQKIAAGLTDVGDLCTVADPNIVDKLIRGRVEE